MPFINGRFIPQQVMPNINMGAAAQGAPAAPMSSNMARMPAPQSNQNFGSTFANIAPTVPAAQNNIPAAQNNIPAAQQDLNNMQAAYANGTMPTQPVSNQTQQAPNWQNGWQGGQQLGMQQGWGGQNFGFAQGQQQQAPNQSITQSVQNNNPQSVQNFLTALNQSKSGNSNQFMNGAGQQGAQAQAGFQGFSQNGYQGPVSQGMGAGGVVGNNINYSANGSYNGPMSFANNNALQGAYGQMGAPTYSGGQASNPAYNAGNNPQFVNPQANQAGGGGMGWTPATSSAYGLMTSTSDILAKDNILPAENELESFLNALGVYSYEYKDKENGEGRRISPMAQEIEKTPIGKVAISTDENGFKKVDYGKLLGTMLASQAMLNQKYNKLEEQLKNNILSSVKQKGKK